VPVIFIRFKWKLEILQKNKQLSNFMEIHPVEAMLFDADGQMDLTKLTLAFHKFLKVPN